MNFFKVPIVRDVARHGLGGLKPLPTNKNMAPQQNEAHLSFCAWAYAFARSV